MVELRRFGSHEDGFVLVEVEDPAEPVMRGGRPAEAVLDAGKSLEQALAGLGPAVKGIVAQLREAADRPDSVEVEFGVKLSADANVIIARTGGEANFRVALKWSQDQGGDG